MSDLPEKGSSPVHILIVEDSPTQLELLQFLLENEGYIVHTACDGLEGLAAARANSLDLVISDIVMPNMDGYELCRALRAEEPLRHLPVILLTSLGDPRDVIRGLESGANNFICKPYDDRALVARVQTVLANTEIRKASQAEMGISIFFAGQRFYITADRLQILDLLLSTYENAVSRNTELINAQEELRILNAQLETRVAQRTAALTAEIEERKRAEVRQHLMNDVLARLNQPGAGKDVIGEIVSLIREATGLEAVGVRLESNQDFPYFVSEGFSENFVQQESSLLRHDAGGKILRDEAGRPILECMCGNILRGRTNADHAYFSKGGSFWTNSSTALLASTSEADRLCPTHNVCNAEGFESVALIPLHTGERILGLLQLNDHRPDRFTQELIEFFEGLGASIGIALSRNQTQEALRQSADRWSTTFDAIADIVCVLSPAQEFLAINRAGCLSLGLPKEQILGRKCYELVHCTDAPIPDCPCMVSLATGKAHSSEYESGGKTLSLVSWPTLGADGQVVSLSHIVRDITVARQAQHQHEKLEEQFRASQKMEAIGRLAGGIAHDFNNLLTVILNYASFALDDAAGNEDLLADLLEVQKAGERASALTSQLLAFSRKQVLQSVPLDLNRIASGMEKMFRRILGEDIHLALNLAPDLGIVCADPGQMEQVLMNLVVNARDAMPQGGRLTIGTANVELDEQPSAHNGDLAPGPFIQLTVRDTGFGMDPHTRENLFEPFFTTKEKGKGTGLGLSTVYGIVKQSGGDIRVESEPGTGAIFQIYLPRDLTQTEGDARPPGAAGETGTETILVVEDEATVLGIATRILAAAGYTLLSASNGDDALRIAEQHPGKIHLVLTDVVMPRMSGREFAERISLARPGVRILFMSGYTDDTILHHGIVDEGTHFLGKPFTSNDLTRKVREVLGA